MFDLIPPSPGFTGELDTANTRIRKGVRYAAWAALALVGWAACGLALVHCVPTRAQATAGQAVVTAGCTVLELVTDGGTVASVCATEEEVANAIIGILRARTVAQRASP